MTHQRIPLALVPKPGESKKWADIKNEIIEASANGEAIVAVEITAPDTNNLHRLLRRSGYALHRRTNKDGGYILWVTPL
jgi:hypothetical protein